MRKKRTRNPMARDLRQPKYRSRVVDRKDKIKYRKRKHKGSKNDILDSNRV